MPDFNYLRDHISYQFANDEYAANLVAVLTVELLEDIEGLSQLDVLDKIRDRAREIVSYLHPAPIVYDEEPSDPAPIVYDEELPDPLPYL